MTVMQARPGYETFTGNTFRIVFMILLLYSPLKSQDTSKAGFFGKFNKATSLKKIELFDNLAEHLRLEYYPDAKESLHAILKKGTPPEKAKTAIILEKLEGIRAYHINNFSGCISRFTRIYNHSDSLTFRDSLEVLYYLKNSYFKLKSIAKALEMHKTMMSIKSRNKKIDPWVFHPLLSAMYYEMGLYREALREQEHEYDEMPKDKSTLTNYFNNRGLFWSRYGSPDSAIACYNRAKQHALSGTSLTSLSVGEQFVIGLIDGNIGQALKLKGEYDKAIPLLQKDIYFSKNSGEYTNAAISHNELAGCYMKLEKFDICNQHLDSARSILMLGQNIKPILDNCRLYAELFSSTSKYREADSAFTRYIHLRDSIELSDNRKQLINQQVALQMEEREKVIEENQRKIKEEQAIIERQKLQRNLLFADALALTLVVIIILVQLQKLSRQKQQLTRINREMQEKKDVIEKALHEKEVLVKEVHHRVKNNLQLVSSLLSLQSGKTTHAEAKLALLEAFDRVSSMALIHQLLYTHNNMALIPIHTYLKNLFDNLSHSYAVPGQSITRNFTADNLELYLDTGIPLGIIANELISNSYKHAFKNKPSGTIRVFLKKETENEYQLTVSDDGNGLPENFDPGNSISLGLEIVQLLCEQINGKFSFLNNEGASFLIRFKIPEKLFVHS